MEAAFPHRRNRISDKRQLWLYAIPIAFFALAEILNDLVLHQTMRIPYEYWQLLDKSLLEHRLSESLLLLHSQPPLFNLLLGVLLKAAAVLHVRVEILASLLFGALGLATGLLLFQLTLEWTESVLAAGVAVFFYYANPSYYGGSNAGIGRDTFFYEFFLQSLLLLVFFSASHWLKNKILWAGLVFVGSIGAVVNTRSLFSPLLWGTTMVGFVLWPGFRKNLKSTVLLSGCAVFLLFFWPLKNYLVFGQFVSSSLDAENLARAYPTVAEPLYNLLARKVAPPAVELLQRFPQLRSFDPEALTAVTSARKSNGVPNTNNLIVLITRPGMLRQAIQARRNYPLTLKWMSIMYLFSTRPMYQQPYTLTYFDGYPRAFRNYVDCYQAVFFSPVGPKVEANRFLNVYNVILLPALILGSLLVFLFRATNRILLGLLTLTTIFPLICSTLTDGFEGNRMQHSTYPLMILLSAIVVRELGLLVLRKRTLVRAQ